MNIVGNIDKIKMYCEIDLFLKNMNTMKKH